MVTFSYLGVYFGNAFADGIVEGSGRTGAIGFPCKILGALGRRIVVVELRVIAVERDECDALVLVREFLFHLAYGLQGFVHSREGLFADDGHRAALVNDNQVVYALVFYFICIHNLYFLNV